MRLWMPLIAILLLPSAAVATASDAARPWSTGYTLFLLEPGADATAAMGRVQAEGGNVAVVVPPRVLLGWLPPASDAALLGRDGIRSIHRAPLRSIPADLEDHAGRAAIRTFGRAVRGELDAPVNAPVAGPDFKMLPDALDPGPIAFDEVRENLRATGKGHIAAGLPDPQLAGNSDYMSGTVTLSLFFVESNGTGADPNLYSWTTTSEQQLFDQAVSGLSWWSNQALNYGACWVAFYVRANFATQDARCAQPLEPVLHPSGFYSSAIETVLGQFGYGSGNHITRATAYNVAQRTTYGTDWAYCAFVAPNPTGANQFTDGRSAWAYLGGPYTALLQRSFGWPFGQVFAHESGHIFRACDEYYQEGYGGCTDCGQCGGTGVPNANCEFCNPGSVSCMMKANSYTLCTYTPGAIGWWRDPCGPGQLPAPVLTSVTPPTITQDSDFTLQLHGQNFTYGMQVNLGEGIQVLSVQNTSSTQQDVQVHVDLDAPAGTRDVVIQTPDAQTDTLDAAFQVISTPKHYVSSSGGNVYPFTTPATAGSSLTTVLAACSDGDTLLLAGGTYGPLVSSLVVQKALVLRGSWNVGFTARDVQATPSIIQGDGASPVVRLLGAGGARVLDGLVIRGGGGEVVSPPEIGTCLAGAGVSCYETTARLVDCVLENNSAGTAFTLGVGGGLFAWNTGITLERCVIRNNNAARGGGLYLLNSTVDLHDNRIEANIVDGSAGTARGAGLAAFGSSLQGLDNVVRANTGAAEGGGLAFENCPSVTLEGVLVEDHATSGLGAGILSVASRLILRASAVLENVSASYGGGILAQDDSLDLVSTRVVGNQSLHPGGGVRAINCVLRLHNATVARNTGGYGSGIYSLQAPAGSEVRNSIVAANTMGGIVFEMGAAPSVDWNLVSSNGVLNYFGATPGVNDRGDDPLFVNAPLFDVHLALHSPGIDSGDPTLLDPDGSASDRGAYGGPLARPDAPPRLQGVQATTQGSQVQITWAPSSAGDVATYAVHRGLDPANVVSAANLLSQVAAPATSWIDVSPVQNAWYVVSAVDATSYAGGYASPVQAGTASDANQPRLLASLQTVSPSSLRHGAWIQFVMPHAAPARVTVYSVDGRRLRTLFDGPRAAGVDRIHWNGRDDAGRRVAPGMYVVRFALDGSELTQKLVLTR